MTDVTDVTLATVTQSLQENEAPPADCDGRVTDVTHVTATRQDSAAPPDPGDFSGATGATVEAQNADTPPDFSGGAPESDDGDWSSLLNSPPPPAASFREEF